MDSMEIGVCLVRVSTKGSPSVLVEAADTVGESKIQKNDEYFCRDLADIAETGARRNFGIDNL